MPPTALITGITGQDGSYLAEFLLERGYSVYGLIRRSSAGPNTRNLTAILDKIELLQGDMTDSDSLKRALMVARPQEVYNLAAQSFVPMSWDSPTYTLNVNLGGFTYLLEAVRSQADDRVRVYQASTSEMFGNVGWRFHSEVEAESAIALNERSPMHPRSPYGLSKLAAHRLAAIYRESFGLFVASGILFNHESPRRGEMFVSRKVAQAVARMYSGKQTTIDLGDLQARRDWGYAGDYVRAMWQMLQQQDGGDFVIGTGNSRSVATLVLAAFAAGEELTGRKIANNPLEERVRVSEKFTRPAEIYALRADPGKAKRELGWEPSVDLDRLMLMMVQSELAAEGVIGVTDV